MTPLVMLASHLLHSVINVLPDFHSWGGLHSAPSGCDRSETGQLCHFHLANFGCSFCCCPHREPETKACSEADFKKLREEQKHNVVSGQQHKVQIDLMVHSLIMLGKILSSLFTCLCPFESLECLCSFAPCMMSTYCRHHGKISEEFLLLSSRGSKSMSSNSSVNLKSLQIRKGGCLMLLFRKHPENRSEISSGKSEVICTLQEGSCQPKRCTFFNSGTPLYVFS